MGLLTPCFVPRGGFFVHNDCRGGGGEGFVHNDCPGERVFAPFKACPGGGWWFWMN